jgi:hypothetical protein
MLSDLRRGGIDRLGAESLDFTASSFIAIRADSFDVLLITFLIFF